MFVVPFFIQQVKLNQLSPLVSLTRPGLATNLPRYWSFSFAGAYPMPFTSFVAVQQARASFFDTIHQQNPHSRMITCSQPRKVPERNPAPTLTRIGRVVFTPKCEGLNSMAVSLRETLAAEF